MHGTVCEMDGGVCYQVYLTMSDAHKAAHTASTEAHRRGWTSMYEPIALPENVPACAELVAKFPRREERPMSPIRMTVDARKALGYSMPESGLRGVAASDHFTYFEAFTGTDVWTRDGWVVTSASPNGITHQVRKDKQVGNQDIAGDEILYFSPSAKTAYYGF